MKLQNAAALMVMGASVLDGAGYAPRQTGDGQRRAAARLRAKLEALGPEIARPESRQVRRRKARTPVYRKDTRGTIRSYAPGTLGALPQ